jgi:transcriptional regulator with XRE-family HTH domain
MKNRIKNMLGSGYTPANVASALGISESYISQLLSDEDFALDVQSLRAATSEKAAGFNSALDDVEDALLKKLTAMLPYITRPKDVTDILSRVNSLKRRGATQAPSTTVNIVQLTIPESAVKQFRISSLGEVVEAGGRSLATMPPAGLLALKGEHDGQRKEIVVNYGISPEEI